MIYCILELNFPQDLSPASVGRQCDVGKSKTFSPASSSLQLVGSTTLGSSEQQEPFMSIVANRSAPAQPPRDWTVGFLFLRDGRKPDTASYGHGREEAVTSEQVLGLSPRGASYRGEPSQR